MNYRHAFHAGNFADVFKHAVLARVLDYLTRKPAPFRFIDTHAGIGLYDLGGAEASRTGEWRGGIGQIAEAAPPAAVAALLAPYLAALGPRDPDGRWRTYPGSPALAQRLLRPQDRLNLCELHSADAEALTIQLGQDRRARVLAGDGYAGLKALVPPAERRGLVLIDPPFESPDEFDRAAEALTRACRKWPTGVYMLWYPIKDRSVVDRLSRTFPAAGLKRVLRLHLSIGVAAEGLTAAGLLIVNPPYVLDDEAAVLLPWLASTLGRDGAGTWSARWLAGD